MTPEQYLGHNAFRTVESKRWPPKYVDGVRQDCFAAILQHRDGTEVLYLRGTATTNPREQMADAVAKDIFGCACHYCVFEFCFGRLLESGEFDYRYGTPQRRGTENQWGELCHDCRLDLAGKAKATYYKRLRDLGFDPEATILRLKSPGGAMNE